MLDQLRIAICIGLACVLLACSGCRDSRKEKELSRDFPLIAWQEYSREHHPVAAMRTLAELRSRHPSKWAKTSTGFKKMSYRKNAMDLCCLGYWEAASKQFIEYGKLGGLEQSADQAWLAYAASLSHNDSLQARVISLLTKMNSSRLARCIRAYSDKDTALLLETTQEFSNGSPIWEVSQLLTAEAFVQKGMARRAREFLAPEVPDRVGKAKVFEMYPCFLYRWALIAEAAEDHFSALVLAEMVLRSCKGEDGGGDFVKGLLYRRIRPFARYLDKKVSQGE